MTTPFFLPQLIGRGYARAAGLRIASIQSRDDSSKTFESGGRFGPQRILGCGQYDDHYKICAGQKPSGKKKGGLFS